MIVGWFSNLEPISLRLRNLEIGAGLSGRMADHDEYEDDELLDYDDEDDQDDYQDDQDEKRPRSGKKLCLGRETGTAASSSQPQPQQQLPKSIQSQQQLGIKIDRLCEFAHVLMHCVLYKINYYNRKTHFDKAIKYDIIVYVRHPSRYIYENQSELI